MTRSSAREGSRSSAVATRSRLDLTRAQILAFRRHVGALDERLPRGSRSLRRGHGPACRTARPALRSSRSMRGSKGPNRLRGRTDRSSSSGGRGTAHTSSRHTTSRSSRSGGCRTTPARGASRKDLAARLHALLGGAGMPYGEAGRALGEHPNRLRYAAPTGTVVIRWDGARQPTVWTVPPPQVDAGDARLELARRYLHIFGPATPQGIRCVGGDRPAPGRSSVRRAPQVDEPGANIGRRRVDTHARRTDVPRRPRGRGARTAPPERRRLPAGRRSPTLGRRR